MNRIAFLAKSSKRAGWIARVILVLLISLAIKFAYLHERVQFPDVDSPTLDSLFHDQWARGLAFNEWTADHERLRHDPYFRAPLYPLFVSTVYRLVGTDPRMLFTLQIIVGALTVVFMFRFCSFVLDERTAWVAVALQLGYWPLTYHEAELLIPVLSLFLDMGFLLALAIAGRSGKLRYTALAGALSGLSAIARPSILVAMPFAAAWLWKRVAVRGRTHALLLGATTMLVILPVTVRNAVRGHDAVLIASQGGVNFFIGNNAEANGITAVVPGTRADWWGGFEDTRKIAEEEQGRRLKPSEISRYWYARGLRFLTGEPREAARLYLRKVAILLGNAEPSNERQLYFRRQQSAVLSLLLVNFAFIVSTALVGLGCSLRAARATKRDRFLPLFVAIPYAAGILAFFVTARFRLPVAMFLIPLSALGCVAIFDWVRARAWSQALRGVAVAALVFIGCMWNPYGVGTLADARAYYGLAVDHYRQGNYDSALIAIDRSLEADRGHAPSWAIRGRTLQHLGSDEQAIRDLETACALDSSFSDAFYWLGVAYQKANQHERAEAPYLRSVALNPAGVEALTNLADVYLRQRRVDDASVVLRKALSVDSTYVNAIYGMGYYYEVTGQNQQAMVYYGRALSFPPARIGLERMQQSTSGQRR